MRSMRRSPRYAAWIICALAVAIVPNVSIATFGPSTALAAPAARASASAPSCAQLPQHLDLRTASDAQLLAYGLPTHAAVLADLSHWTQWLASRPVRDCAQPDVVNQNGAPLNIGSTNALAPPSGTVVPTMSGYRSSNWSGNVATAARGTYRKAEVTIQVPSITGTVDDIASAWTGVGGDSQITSPNVLVQAGVYVQKKSSGQRNVSWVEVYPQVAAYNLPLCRLDVGDTVDVYVTSNLNNDGYDYFELTNTTASCYNSCTVHTNNTGIHDTCGFSGGSGYNSDSATGECIVERVDGLPIAQWNPPGHEWRQHYCDINGTEIGALTHRYYTIVDSTGDTLVYPGSLNSYGSFNQVWVARS
jgi:hypothetical protein